MSHKTTPEAGTLCACGRTRERKSYTCRACDAERSRASYARRRKKIATARKARRAAIDDPDRQRLAAARAHLGMAIYRKKKKKGPCEVCGDARVHPLFDDLARPLDVRWFCKEHRAESLRAAALADMERAKRAAEERMTPAGPPALTPVEATAFERNLAAALTHLADLPAEQRLAWDTYARFRGLAAVGSPLYNQRLVALFLKASPTTNATL